MASINDFKVQSQKDFARPNLFQVVVTHPDYSLGDSNRVRFNCHSASIPGIQLATTDKDIAYRSIVYQKIYEDITLSFYCREDMKELEYFQKWIQNIISATSTRVEYVDKYKSDNITITQLGKNGKNTTTTKLYDAYPKKIDAISLDYNSTSSLISVSVTITYRYYTQDFHEDKKIDEVASETSGGMYAHTVDTEGNKVSIMNSISDKKQNWKMRGENGSEEGFDLEF